MKRVLYFAALSMLSVVLAGYGQGGIGGAPSGNGGGSQDGGSSQHPEGVPPTTTAPTGPETYEAGEAIELTPAGNDLPPTPVTVEVTSAETYQALERDARYDTPGAEQGPFAVVTFDFTNRSESEYISATEVFNFALQTSQTERATTGSLSTFEIQPQEKEENADAAPGTTREVVLIFDIEEGEELRYFVFVDQASFQPAARVELSNE